MTIFQRPANLEPAIYEGTLTGISDEQRKKFESEEMETVMTFAFRVDHDGKSFTLKRSVRPIISSKSNLMKDLRAMMGAKALDAVIGNDGLLWAAVQNMVGRVFLIQTDVTESGNTKVVSVMAKPGGTAPAQQSLPTSAPVMPLTAAPKYTEDPDEDAIPF